MKESLPSTKLSALSDFLDKNMGLYYPEKAWSGFEKKLPEIAKALGFSNISECVDYLLQKPVTHELICTLAKHLTIGETYFFRDLDSLKKIMSKVITPLVNERNMTSKSLRIWSAACCTGEEPYSIAMMLTHLIPDYKLWNISILGTDINLEFLKIANEGKYRDWSFRNTSEEMKKKFFIKHKNYYELIPDIKKMVHFSYLNLVEDNYPSLNNGTVGLDLIICNNVLIYFSETQIKKVTNQLGRCLTDHGYLVVTAIESPFVSINNLSQQKEIAGNFFKKKSLEVKEHKKNYISTPSPEKYSVKKKIEIHTPKTSIPETFDEVDILKKANQSFSEGNYHKTIEIIKKNKEGNHWFNDKQIMENNHLISLLIKAFANLGEIDRSLEICENGLKLHTIDPVLHYLHAAVLQEIGDLDKAIQALKKALFLDSQFVIAYFSLANIYLIKSNLKESKKNFRNVRMLLEKQDDESLVAEGEGLTSGRLREIVLDIEKKIDDKISG